MYFEHFELYKKSFLTFYSAIKLLTEQFVVAVELQLPHEELSCLAALLTSQQPAAESLSAVFLLSYEGPHEGPRPEQRAAEQGSVSWSHMGSAGLGWAAHGLHISFMR